MEIPPALQITSENMKVENGLCFLLDKLNSLLSFIVVKIMSIIFKTILWVFIKFTKNEKVSKEYVIFFRNRDFD